jgi:hypothetical protein
MENPPANKARSLPIVNAIAVVCLAGVVALWWQEPQREYSLILFVLVSLLVTGLWWLQIFTSATSGWLRSSRPRPRPRVLQWAMCPVLIVLAFVIPRSGLSYRRNFDAARSGFDSCVKEVEAGGSPNVPAKFGRFEVRSIRQHDGAVFFTTDRNPDTEYGVVWSPMGPPPKLGDWVRYQSAHSISEGWYRFTQSNDP